MVEFTISGIMAKFCYDNPNNKVLGSDYKTFFWYSPEARCFMCQKPSNKMMNGVYKARGLCSHFIQYMRNFDHAFDDIRAEDFFDMK